MEQLVHLRLKSIYKAFQQSNPKGGGGGGGASSSHNKSRDTASTRAVAAAAAAAACGASASRDYHSAKAAPPEKKEKNEKTFSARQAEADLAAAELLAELEEEEEVQKKKTSKKKKKKAQKKKKQEDLDEDDEVIEKSTLEEEEEDEEVEPEEQETPAKVVDESMEEEDIVTPPPEEKMDPDEIRLYEMVADSDGDGIEALLAEMRGVPGRAALRKNAKKALKRLREEQDRVREEEETEFNMASDTPGSPVQSSNKNSSSSYKPPEPLLTLVSRNVHSNSKSECVLHMSPQVVGWVIGKGGQRIRDLMEDSGSKVWIDQDSMGPNDARIVYVSGPGKAVDDAVRRIKDLVAKAPVGGTTTGMTVASHSSTSNKKPPPSPDIKPMEGPKSSPARARSTSLTKDKDWAVHEITCEARFVPLLIGRRGWTIKHIQDSSGARVDIDQSVTPRRIKISGKKDCVATAIHMVKDVLSYPHAQLDRSSAGGPPAAAVAASQEAAPTTAAVISGAPLAAAALVATSEEEIASLEAHRNLSNHSPPPSSLIMTSDVKSTISASSSLSSTPEPSMASTSKSSSYKHPGPLYLGDVIPPNYAGHAPPPYLQASLQGGVPQSMEQPPLAMANSAAIGAVGSSGGLPQPTHDARFVSSLPQGGPLYGQAAPQFDQQRQLHCGMSFGHPQQQPGQGLHHSNSAPIGGIGAPGFGQSQQLGSGAPYGQQQSLDGSSLLRDALLGSTQQQGAMRQDSVGQPGMPPQQSRPVSSFPADSYQPAAHLLFQKPDAMPGDNVNDTEAFAPDLFGRDRNLSGGISSSEHNNMEHSSSYLFPGQRLAHRQNSDSQIPPHIYSEPHLGARRNSAPALPPQHGAPLADSDIVDSLFGPPVGGREHSLLSGIQGLNLNSNAAGEPGWVSSIAGWGSENINNAGAPTQRADQSNFVLSGGIMLNGSQQQQQQQQQNQPPSQQSRFDWG